MSGARELSLFEGWAELEEEAGRWIVALRWAPRRTRLRRQPVHELIVLEVAPPEAWREGEALEVRSARYTLGHAIVLYESAQLQGEVRVLERRPTRAILSLQLCAEAPTIDEEARGSALLSGLVEVELR